MFVLRVKISRETKADYNRDGPVKLVSLDLKRPILFSTRILATNLTLCFEQIISISAIFAFNKDKI